VTFEAVSRMRHLRGHFSRAGLTGHRRGRLRVEVMNVPVKGPLTARSPRRVGGMLVHSFMERVVAGTYQAGWAVAVHPSAVQTSRVLTARFIV
jgi:hypothetical protein